MADRDYGKPKFGYEDRPQPSAPPTPPGRADAAAAGFEIEEVRERGQQAQVGRLPVTSDSPVEVYFQEEAYRQIRNQVMGAAPLKGDPRRHKEAGGILYGEVTPVVGGKYVVNVREAVAVQGGASSRTQFTIGNQDWVTAHAEIRRRRGDDHQLEVVGVYHSHPGHGIFHSATDAQSLGRKGGQFTAPYHFSMVVDHITRSGKSPHGRMGVLVDNVKVGEFNFEAPFPGLFQARAQVPAAPAKEAGAIKMSPPATAAAQSRRKAWVLTLLAIAISPVFGLFYLWHLLRSLATHDVVGSRWIEDEWGGDEWFLYGAICGLFTYVCLCIALLFWLVPLYRSWRPSVTIEDVSFDRNRAHLTCLLNRVETKGLSVSVQYEDEKPEWLEPQREKQELESERQYRVGLVLPKPLTREGDYRFVVSSKRGDGSAIAQSGTYRAPLDLPPAKIRGVALQLDPQEATGEGREKVATVRLSWKQPRDKDVSSISLKCEEEDLVYDYPSSREEFLPATQTNWREDITIHHYNSKRITYMLRAQDRAGNVGEWAVAPKCVVAKWPEFRLVKARSRR